MAVPAAIPGDPWARREHCQIATEGWRRFGKVHAQTVIEAKSALITFTQGAGNAQAAQGMGMIVFPFAFVSSAYVPVSSMPGWLQVFAKHQPLTYMVDSVRALTVGPHAQALLGHPTSYFLVRALAWTVAILAVFLPIAVAKSSRS